jgi:hypothetical protein
MRAREEVLPYCYEMVVKKRRSTEGISLDLVCVFLALDDGATGQFQRFVALYAPLPLVPISFYISWRSCVQSPEH